MTGAQRTRSGSGLTFFLSAWLVLVVISAVTVGLLANTVNAKARQLDPAPSSPAGPTSTGPDNGSSLVGAAGQVSSPTSHSSTSSRSRSSTSSTTQDDPDVPWIIILRSYDKSEFSYDDATIQAGYDINGSGYRIVDSDDYLPWLEDGYWVAVHGDYATRDAAAADCPRFGETAGSWCYFKQVPLD